MKHRPLMLAGAALVLLTGPTRGDDVTGGLKGHRLTFGTAASLPKLLSPEMAGWASRLPSPASISVQSELIFNAGALEYPSRPLTRVQCDRMAARQTKLLEGRSSAEASDPKAGQFVQTGLAVWNQLHGKTASGEIANPGSLTAGHRTLPLGSRVRVVNRTNGASVVVRINDRGPVQKKFAIDLTKGAAHALGITGASPVSIYLLAGLSAKLQTIGCAE